MRPLIHPKNAPLRDLSPDHPIVVALCKHAEACVKCVGKEIGWPDQGSEPIDQAWESSLDGRTWKFSSFAYLYIGYDLIADGWIESSPILTDAELTFLSETYPRMIHLLGECEVAALNCSNVAILPLIDSARDFADALAAAFEARARLIAADELD
jgi:hypothetical protein